MTGEAAPQCRKILTPFLPIYLAKSWQTLHDLTGHRANNIAFKASATREGVFSRGKVLSTEVGF
jgi:hypothetical protein